jgi:hypothetical protein
MQKKEKKIEENRGKDLSHSIMSLFGTTKPSHEVKDSHANGELKVPAKNKSNNSLIETSLDNKSVLGYNNSLNSDEKKLFNV